METSTLKKCQAALIGLAFTIINKQCDGLLMAALCLLNRLKTRKNRSNFSSRSVLRWTCFLNNTANIESSLSC